MYIQTPVITQQLYTRDFKASLVSHKSTEQKSGEQLFRIVEGYVTDCFQTQMV